MEDVATASQSPAPPSNEELSRLFQEVLENPNLVSETLDNLKQVREAMKRKLEEAHRRDETRNVDQWFLNYYEPLVQQVQEMQQVKDEVEALAAQMHLVKQRQLDRTYVPQCTNLPQKQQYLEGGLGVIQQVKKKLPEYAELLNSWAS